MSIRFEQLCVQDFIILSHVIASTATLATRYFKMVASFAWLSIVVKKGAQNRAETKDYAMQLGRLFWRTSREGK